MIYTDVDLDRVSAVYATPGKGGVADVLKLNAVRTEREKAANA